MTEQQQAEQQQGETETETERLLKTGPVRTRQENIQEGTASFLGLHPSKVVDVLRGVWTTSKGQEPLTASEIGAGMALISRYELDPFNREIYVTRDKQGRLMIIIGLDGWIRVLDRTDHYDGFEQELIFDDDGELTEVVTRIFSKKREHPATYRAYAKEYARLGGYMREKIPWHMLRIFSLKHAGRLFVPLGSVVTEEEAHWMGSTEPESDNTAKHIEQARAAREQPPPPPLPKIPPPPPAARVEPPFQPPTEAEAETHKDRTVAIAKEIYPTPGDQAATAEEMCERIGNVVSLSSVEQFECDVVKCVEQHKISQTHAVELSELITAARVRVKGLN